MKLIKALLDTVEHQFLTLVGTRKGYRTVILTDRRLTILERCHEDPNGDEPFAYISSPIRDKFSSKQCPMELDENGLPPWPDKCDLISPAEEAERSSRKVIDPVKVLEVIDSQFAGMAAFAIPGAVHTLKQKWLAFRVADGDMHMRISDEYAELNTADEAKVGEAPAKIEGELSFAIPIEFFRAIHAVYPGAKLMMGVKPGRSVAVRVGTPSADILYLCKTLKLEEPKEEEETVTEEPSVEELAANIPGTPEKVEETVEEPEKKEVEEESVQEPEASEAPEEEPEGDDDDGDEGRSDDGDGDGVDTDGDAAPRPTAEDIDPLKALDEVLPGINKEIKEVVHKGTVEVAKVLKNVAKQVRKKLGKSQADPEEVKKLKSEIADLKKELAKAEKQRDVAKQTLKEML